MLSNLLRGLLAAAALACVVKAAVVDLTPDNFDTVVDGSQNVLVEFFAPWCGHCKTLAPEYEVVGETYKAGDGVVIAKIDADKERSLGERFDVKGFPTLKWFGKGDTKGEEFNAPRTADGIIKAINDKTGLNRKVKKAPSAVVDLTVSNFDSIVLDPTKDALVEFYAPWCGHCKSLVPTWEKLAKVFEGEKNVVVGKVDATEQRDLGNRYDVSGYPTLKFFPKGSSDAEAYNGGRDIKDFVEFLNVRAGTARTTDGGLLPTAGRVEALDKVVASGSISEKTLAEAKGVVGSLSGDEAKKGELYVKAIEKVIAKGPEYIDTEIARLQKLLDGQVNAEKKTLFLTRLNVLKAFKPAEGEEPVSEEL